MPEVKGKPEAFIIAAPIGIGEKTYRLLMEVRRDANMQRLYVHEAVLRDNVAIDGFVSAADHSDGIKPHSPHKGYIYNFMLGLREKQAQGASKVVDANGEPLVVYHGTSADFDTFSVRESSTNSGNDGYYGKGFYFSVYDGEASTYGVAVVPAYLNIKNPIEDFSKDIENIAINNYGYEKTKQSINHGFIVQKIKEADANAGLLAELFIKTGVNDKRKMWDDFKSFGGSMQSKLNLNEVIDMLEEPLSYEREIISQFGEIPDSEYIYGFNAEPDIRHLTDNGNHAKTFSDIAKNGGFDGVFANSEIIAFYPNQIKSAIGNVGTFSKESNKIMDAAQMLNTLDLIEPDLIDEGFEV